MRLRKSTADYAGRGSRASPLTVVLREIRGWRATARSAKRGFTLWGCDLQKWKFFRARNTRAQQLKCKSRLDQGLAVELATFGMCL
jgi:hypothetical protein